MTVGNLLELADVCEECGMTYVDFCGCDAKLVEQEVVEVPVRQGRLFNTETPVEPVKERPVCPKCMQPIWGGYIIKAGTDKPICLFCHSKEKS